jgi:hypothetical protein
METTEALARVRVLRAAAYYCQAVAPNGARCRARAHDVHPLNEEHGLALCPFHYAERGHAVRRRPLL